jgi:ankyrin repeat protein
VAFEREWARRHRDEPTELPKRLVEPRSTPVTLALEPGADVNKRGEAGITPLMLADETSFDLLLARGANPRARDDAGRSAMSYVNHARGYRALIKAGLDPDEEDVGGTTPLARTLSRYDEETEIVAALVEGGANLRRRDEQGLTPLTRAAKDSSFERLRNLVLHKAVVDVPDGEGKTALRYAVESNDWDSAVFLLKHGANPDLVDLAGDSPRAVVFREPESDSDNERLVQLRRELVRIQLRQRERATRGIGMSRGAPSTPPSPSSSGPRVRPPE